MITTTQFAIYLICFAVGYIAGRLDFIAAVVRGNSGYVKPQGFFDKPAKQINKRETGSSAPQVDEIDTRVYVAPISTDNLTKTNESQLGKTSVTSDNINQSVSKLSQLKGR